MYTTLEEARDALQAAIADCLGDNPELAEDEVAWDLVEAIAGFSTPEVAAELRRTEFGI